VRDLPARRSEHHLAQGVSADAGIDVSREEAGDPLSAILQAAVGLDGGLVVNALDDFVGEVFCFDDDVAVAGPPLVEDGDQRASVGVGRLDLGEAIDRVWESRAGKRLRNIRLMR
jgi:hypothetical protein